MNVTPLLIGLAPWVLFGTVAGHIGPGAVGYAALAACLVSLLLALHGLRTRGRVGLVDATGVVTFAVLGVVGLIADTQVQQHLIDYGRGGAALVLAALMLGSVVFVPFTEQYAREQVDARYWTMPEFRAINRKISLTWGLLVLVLAGCHLASGYLEAHGDNPRLLLLNWCAPIAAIVIGVKRTQALAQTGGSLRPTGETA